MSHHSKDHKLLAEAYEQVAPQPTSPMPEKPVVEAPKATKPVPTANKSRGWFAVYIDGPTPEACEQAAEVVKGMVLELSGKLPNNCTTDTDSGPLEYDKEKE